jgi:hypothetical protein
MTKDQLRELVEGLTDDDLRTLRSIINGKIGKRKITPEQQADMQAARKLNASKPRPGARGKRKPRKEQP